MNPAAAIRCVFPPEVAIHLVKLACELPDGNGRSLSLWTCAELARTLREEQVVERISPQTVQRILHSHKLKPWRVHHWLNSKTPRDAVFRAKVLNICDLYTRELNPYEQVLCLDEKTSLQPRTRTQATRPPKPGCVPARLEHEYLRKGACHLLAAFNTRTGKVTGIVRRRKRQAEVIELLELIHRTTPASITLIHILCDNVSTHHGKQMRAWLDKPPRFQLHFTPVHCSWMNQVEQWFSILQRKRLTAPNFSDLDDLEAKLLTFIDQWNQQAHPFKWGRNSFDNILSKMDATHHSEQLLEAA